MKNVLSFSVLTLLAVGPLGCCRICHKLPPDPSVATCPDDAVRVGPTCVDKYEASVWWIDPSRTALIGKVKAGRPRWQS
jgi:hypothetical protein